LKIFNIKKILSRIVLLSCFLISFLFNPLVTKTVLALPDGSSWVEAGTDALPVATSYLSSIVFNSKMWVIGGNTGSATRKVYYSTDGITWTEAGTDALPVGTYNHTSVVFDSKMWVIGGNTGAGGVDAIKRKVYYSTDGITWTEAGTDALPVRTEGHSSVVFDSKMWVIGGSVPAATRKVYYSSDGITWTEAGTNALPVATYNHSSVVFDSKMWVIGGYAGGLVRKVYYSSDGITWTEAGTNALPVVTGWSAAVVFDSKMWVIGGATTSFARSRRVYSSADGITWTEAGTDALPVATYTHSSVVYDSQMWLIGGDTGSRTRKVYYTPTPDSAAPSISLSAFSPDPTSDATPAITGTATEDEGTVSSVEYQMDGTTGSWTACTADDGTFDEASEAFTCTVSPALADGAHTIYVRATDSNSNTTSNANASTDSFTIDTTVPISLTLDSPTGYTKDFTRPTLVFKKATDATAGISSYSVFLDDGKNQNWSTTGIPASGNGSSAYVWKDDSSVKVEFTNENDSDSTNDQIRVYFKGLDSAELTEGKHSWKVIAYDNAGNSKEESKDFYLDKTNPSISELAVANVSTVAQGQVYKLNVTNRTPSFSGKASDPYQGSTKTNANDTKDTFDKVCSGPLTLTLTLKRKDSRGDFIDHLTKEYSLTDIKDEPLNEKYARFYITVPYPLIDGYYQTNLSLKDQVGNSYNYPVFYLSLNYSSAASGVNYQTQGNLQTEITNQEQIPVQSEEEKQQVQQQGYTVQVKVISKQNQPIINARVEIHSDIQTSYTDKQGIALFHNVPGGNHLIKIAYANFTREQKVTLEGDNTKQFNFDIRVTEESKTPIYKNPVSLVLATVVLSLLVSILFSLWRKRQV